MLGHLGRSDDARRIALAYHGLQRPAEEQKATGAQPQPPYGLGRAFQVAWSAEAVAGVYTDRIEAGLVEVYPAGVRGPGR